MIYNYYEYCPKCRRTTCHTAQRTNHILHLLLSIVTAGLWSIMWLIIAFRNSMSNQCTKCEEKHKLDLGKGRLYSLGRRVGSALNSKN